MTAAGNVGDPRRLASVSPASLTPPELVAGPPPPGAGAPLCSTASV